jgi:hypothetical protein
MSIYSRRKLVDRNMHQWPNRVKCVKYFSQDTEESKYIYEQKTIALTRTAGTQRQNISPGFRGIIHNELINSDGRRNLRFNNCSIAGPATLSLCNPLHSKTDRDGHLVIYIYIYTIQYIQSGRSSH